MENFCYFYGNKIDGFVKIEAKLLKTFFKKALLFI